MSFDLEKFEAVAELGEVIRLQNEAMDRLKDFRKSRPYLIMPNLAKMVEENMKENVQVLYKELNNLHRPAEQQTRYICQDCQMAFLVKLPGGICDECRSKRSTKPREYVVNAPPFDPNAPDDNNSENQTPAPVGDATDIIAETVDTGDVPMDDQSREGVAADAEHAAAGDKLPIEEEAAITENPPADVSGADSEIITQGNAAAEGDTEAEEEMSEEFKRFMEMAGTDEYQSSTGTESSDTPPPTGDVFSETDLHVTDDRNPPKEQD